MLPFGGGLEGGLQHLPELRAMCAEAIEGAGFNEFFDGGPGHGFQVHALGPKFDQAARESRDFEQVVHQPAHVRDLADHDLGRPANPRIEMVESEWIDGGSLPVLGRVNS